MESLSFLRAPIYVSVCLSERLSIRLSVRIGVLLGGRSGVVHRGGVLGGKRKRRPACEATGMYAQYYDARGIKMKGPRGDTGKWSLVPFTEREPLSELFIHRTPLSGVLLGSWRRWP